MEFLADFQNWINQLKKERPNLIIVGDYNIAHTEMDIHNPKSNKKTSGFLPEEREWMSQWFDSGFTDAFRAKHPEKVEYSWWSYRNRNWETSNRGRRLDHIWVSKNLFSKVQSGVIYKDTRNWERPSDHVPIIIDINI